LPKVNFALVRKIMMKILVGLAVFGLVTSGSASNAATPTPKPTVAKTSTSVKGPAGQTLTVSAFKNLVEDQEVVVSGKGYNLKTGIYVTVCVVPAKGKKPEICGAYDITGQNSQAVWVSSNPPLYAQLLVTPFGKGGTFKVTLPMKQVIHDNDCKKVRCAILTRADHTNAANRKADVLIPITFK
jgi:hypothetical protein